MKLCWLYIVQLSKIVPNAFPSLRKHRVRQGGSVLLLDSPTHSKWVLDRGLSSPSFGRSGPTTFLGIFSPWWQGSSLFLMFSSVSPVLSPLSHCLISAPPFPQDHPHLQPHCTPFLSMVSGFPHSPPMILGLFTALIFLPWFQGFLIHPPCSQGSPALPHFLYGLRASQQFLMLMAPLSAPFPGRTSPKP